MITAKDGNGAEFTLASDLIGGEHYPKHCVCPNGEIDNYLSEFALDEADSNNEHANKDYSVTPASFVLKPGAGVVWYIARMMVYVEDAGSFDSGGYGNGSALTNGIEIKVMQGVTEKISITNDQPVKQNTHWKKFCYDIEVSNFGLGNESLGARWTFTRGGTYIKLDGDQGEYISVNLSDDFTFLVDQTFLFQGFIQ